MGEIILIIFLLIIAIIFIWVEPKSESNRWIAITLFLSSGCCIASILQHYMSRLDSSTGFHKLQLDILKQAAVVLSFLGYSLAPYAFLMFSLYVSGIIKKYCFRYKKVIAVILLIPPVVVFTIYPSNIFSHYSMSHLIVQELYILAADGLLVYSWIYTRGSNDKREQFIISIIAIPVTVFGLIVNNMDYAGYKLNTVNINIVIFICLFYLVLLLLFFIIRYGMLGVSIKIRKSSLDNSINKVITKTLDIHHDLKNECIKVAICCENIRNKLGAEYNKIDSSLNIIEGSTEKMMSITSRIRDSLQNSELNESGEYLDQISNEALQAVEAFIDKNGITVTKHYNCKPLLICDREALVGALCNILINSVEAMDYGGRIVIRIFENNGTIVLSVEDTGKGIPAEIIPYLVLPFYSTRKKKQNFGLGLSYCNAVMQKHGSKLLIQSKENAGTTVKFVFPACRVLKPLERVSEQHGKNTCADSRR